MSGENYITRNSGDLYFLPNTVQVIKSRKGVGGTCSMYGGEKRYIRGFGGET